MLIISRPSLYHQLLLILIVLCTLQETKCRPLLCQTIYAMPSPRFFPFLIATQRSCCPLLLKLSDHQGNRESTDEKRKETKKGWEEGKIMYNTILYYTCTYRLSYTHHRPIAFNSLLASPKLLSIRMIRLFLWGRKRGFWVQGLFSEGIYGTISDNSSHRTGCERERDR